MMNTKKHAFRSRWWLLVGCFFLGVSMAGGLGTQSAHAAQARATQRRVEPLLPACSQCISDISPADGSTAQTDANGKVTISISAQLDNNFTKFEIQVDQTTVDQTQIQVTGDPTAPTAQVKLVLTGGKHHVFAQVDDASGPVASAGWDFTVVVTATPVPSATPTTVATTGPGGPSGGGTSTNPTTAKGGIVLNTVSLIFFSVAVVGLLVIAFIAGMWFGGRRLPTA